MPIADTDYRNRLPKPITDTDHRYRSPIPIPITDTDSLAVTLYRKLVVYPWPSHLRDQLKRAASSVVLNLAEGSGKPTTADRRRFYAIAFGSLREVQAVMDLALVEGALVIESDKVAASIYCLMRHPGP